MRITGVGDQRGCDRQLRELRGAQWLHCKSEHAGWLAVRVLLGQGTGSMGRVLDGGVGRWIDGRQRLLLCSVVGWMTMNKGIVDA